MVASGYQDTCIFYRICRICSHHQVKFRNESDWLLKPQTKSKFFVNESASDWLKNLGWPLLKSLHCNGPHESCTITPRRFRAYVQVFQPLLLLEPCFFMAIFLHSSVSEISFLTCGCL